MWGEHLYGSIPTYRTFVLLSAVVGAAVVVVSARRVGLSAWRAFLLELGLGVAAVVGAKLWGVFEEGAYERLAWTNFIGGFRYPGALLGILVATPILCRTLFRGLPAAALGDLVAPSIGFAEVVGRMGCFLSGCCFGDVCDLPWAVRFPRDSPAFRFQGLQGLLSGSPATSLPVHPLQLYFALLALGIGVYLLWFQRRKSYDGQVLLLFVALHEWGKFLLEFLRAPVSAQAGFYLQVASLTLALLATGVLLVRLPAGRRAAAAT
jgi:phosphatidylglycerol---prolipoprotein diacylglyceryl transferase